MDGKISGGVESSNLNRARLALIVGGAPRSGTTLLCDILNEQPTIGIYAEYFLSDFLKDLSPIFNYETEVAAYLEAARCSSNGLEQLAPISEPNSAARAGSAALNSVDMAWSKFVPIGPRDGLKMPLRFPRRSDFAEIVTAIFKTALRKPGITIVGSKTPSFENRYRPGDIEAVFSDTRFLFVVRNPRDTINSSLNRRNRTKSGHELWRIEDVASAIAEYKASIRTIISFCLDESKRTFLIKYEDLIDREEWVLDVLSSFLGVSLVATQLPCFNNERFDVLSGPEKSLVDSELGGLADGWLALSLTGSGQKIADRLYPALRVIDNKPIDLQGTDGDRSILGTGWSFSESAGVWSDQEKASLLFTVEKAQRARLVLEILPFMPTAAGVSVDIFLNDILLFAGDIFPGNRDSIVWEEYRAKWAVVPGQFLKIPLGPVALQSGAVNHMLIALKGVVPASNYGLKDPRLIGVMLKTFQIVEVPTF